MELYFLLLIIPICSSNWESEWLLPIKDTYSSENTMIAPGKFGLKISDDQPLRMEPQYYDSNQQEMLKKKEPLYGAMDGESISSSFTQKLRDTLKTAKALAENLKSQIRSISIRENLLKQIIVTGKSGVTVLTVLLLGKLPRTYIIRDGFWTLCNGMVQYPTNGQGSSDVFNDLFAAPRCIGQEITSRPDPCVFNSVVKYETIPRQRGIVYAEDDYLCLKPSFNETLEQYLSVPKNIVNETCRDGTVRKLNENTLQCGPRVMSEYTYYPHRNIVNRFLPVEYCLEKDGSCKLIVAWHISNTSVENFEFIKNDRAFKKFFMNTF